MKMLTTTQAAEQLGISAIRVRQLISNKRLPTEVVGGRHFINPASLKLRDVSKRKPGWRLGRKRK